MLLCYDKLFPRRRARCASTGAEILVLAVGLAAIATNPAAAIRDDIQTRHFDLCDQTRAVENQVFVVSANQTGPWGPLRFLGSAKVVDPGGFVLAATGADEGLAVAEVDLGAIHEIRLRHRPSGRSPAGCLRAAAARGRRARLRALSGSSHLRHVRHRRGARRL
jgi:predicted amidohydrolase